MRIMKRDSGEMRNESWYCIVQISPDYGVPFGHMSLNRNARWYNGESAKVRCWIHDCTMMKQRWHDGEITMMRWHDVENNIAFSSSFHRSFIIAPSYFRHRNIVFSTSYFQRFQHRLFVVSPSYSYHRVFTIVNGIPYVLCTPSGSASQISWFRDIRINTLSVGFRLKIS
jgi:hypothetical protein